MSKANLKKIIEDWFKDLPYFNDTQENTRVLKELIKKDNSISLTHFNCYPNLITFSMIVPKVKLECIACVKHDGNNWKVLDNIVAFRYENEYLDIIQ